MPIPRIIHQTWKGSPDTLPEIWQDSYQQWVTLANKHHFTYRFWTDIDIDQFIKEEFPWFLEKFRSYPYGIQRADTFRYFVLYHYGGIYSDFDNVPKESLFTEWFVQYQHQGLILPYCKPGNEVGLQNITNAFMASEPRHPFWVNVWYMLYNPTDYNPWKEAFLVSHYFEVIFTTGPGLLSDAYHSCNRIKRHVHLCKDTQVQLGCDGKYMTSVCGNSWHDTTSISQYWSQLYQLRASN